MKNSISLNHYPDNYVEEELPQVIVEIRYRNDGKFNRRKANMLSNEIEEFLNKKGDKL